MDLGRIGIWTGQLDMLPAAEAQAAVAELEDLGYGAIWLPEATGRESFANSGLLLGGSRRIVVATGITNMWGRDPVTMAAAQKTLAEAYPDRFLLGIGVSHQPMVENVRGHTYTRPLAAMRAYLEAMDAAPFTARPPSVPPLRVLAALRTGMLKLAASHANGAHPYCVPVEHTRRARAIMGQGPLLAPEQGVVLNTDPQKARAIAHQWLERYLRLPNYANNLRELGFGDDDLAGQGSDRLADAIVAWGDLDAIAQRVREHHEAGADHVCIQVLGSSGPPREEWRRLAALLR
jgi:probable F420-dependent oxidoreductase